MKNELDLRWTTPTNSIPTERLVVLYLEEETEIHTKITVKTETDLRVYFYSDDFIEHNVYKEGGYRKILDMIFNDERCEEIKVVTPDLKSDTPIFQLETFRSWKGKRILGWFLSDGKEN